MDQDHVARNQASSIGPTSSIGLTPEDHRPIVVRRVTQYLMEVDSETVQVADVQRAKIGMEGVIKKRVVNGKIYGGLILGPRRCSSSLGSPGRPFAWRLWLRGIREWGVFAWLVGIGCEIQPV